MIASELGMLGRLPVLQVDLERSFALGDNLSMLGTIQI